MSLPQFQTEDQAVSLQLSTWATALNPLLANPLNTGSLLTGVVLVAGLNVINHKLGRKLQGWVITRQRAAATFYDTQDTNQRPALTLNLQSTGPVTVDIYVF